MRRLVLLGGTGDLAIRHLLPAVALLAERGMLSEELEILALARERYDQAQYRQQVAVGLAAASPRVSRGQQEWLVQRLRYAPLDLTDAAAARAVLDGALEPGPSVCYLALPPYLLPAAVRALASTSPRPDATVVVEKPFGEDAASARSLEDDLAATLAQRQIYRADHFLHHQAVQDVVALRSDGGALDRLWHRDHVEAVEIVWEEAGAVAGRAELFDRLGSIRDMVQSHLLQLLALVAMEPPAAWDETALQEARLAVLRAVRTPEAEQARDQVVRGRYTSGSLAAGPVVGYLDEPGVDPGRGTETYVSLQLAVELERWRGVRFVLRTGKAIGAPRRFVDLRLRGDRTGGRPASIRLAMDHPGHPAQVSLGGHASGPVGLPQLAPATLASTAAAADLPATGRLLRDVLAGRQALFPSAEEVQECWRITDALLAVCGGTRTVLADYPAGSAGPLTSF